MYELKGQRIYKGDNIVATFPTSASATCTVSVEEAGELAKVVYDILKNIKAPAKPQPQKKSTRSSRKAKK